MELRGSEFRSAAPDEDHEKRRFRFAKLLPVRKTSAGTGQQRPSVGGGDPSGGTRC